MALPVTFGTETAATGGQLDENFSAVGVLGTIPCTLSGTNSIVLTPAANTPTIGSYSNYLRYSGIISVTNTGAVTVNASSIGALPAYKDSTSGPAALSGSELQAGNAVVFTFDQALNSGGGGFHVVVPTAGGTGTVTSVASGTGLTGGPITTTGTLSFATIANLRLLANVSGGTAVPSASTLTNIFDQILGTAQGNIIYRGAATWGVLAPGTSGQVLETQGAGANPQWITPVSQTNTTWTPTDASGAGLSFSAISASYTQIGNMVFYYAQLTYPATADGSNAKIGGLPVSVFNANYAQTYGSAKSASVSSLQNIQAIKNTTTAGLLQSSSAAVLNSALSAAIVIINGFYPVA